MPQNDAVSKALAGAKATLKNANTAFPSAKAPVSSQAAAPAPKPAAPAPKPAPTTGDELKAKQDNVNTYLKSIPKMHVGGPVTEDGPYQLKAGEHVLTEPEAKKARKHALMAVGMKSLAKPGKSFSNKG